MKKSFLIYLISMSGIFGMVEFSQAQDTIVSPVDTTEYITQTFSTGLFSGTSSFTSSLYDDTTFPGNVIVDGNLGLGVADPLEKLHISGAIRGDLDGGKLRINSIHGSLNIGAGNNLFAHLFTDRDELAINKPTVLLTGELRSYANTDLKLETNRGPNKQTRITILNSNGNVGIGTTSPTEKLSVTGRISVAPSGTSPDNTYHGNIVVTKPLASGQYINLIRYGQYPWSIGMVYNTNIFAIGSGTASDANFNNPFFVINTSGKVGIGTTDPSEKLTIAGGHGNTNMRLYSTGDGSGQPANLSLWASEPGWTYCGTGIGYNVNGSPHYGRIDNTKGSSYVRFLPGETKFMFQKTTGVDVDAVTINELGNVGIGRTPYQDYKLDVAGTVRVQAIKINMNSGADFVFEPDYKLMPLGELDEFIKTNKHLPDISSAAEMTSTETDLGEMQIKQLQKIEELTLYMIEQQKEISRLKTKIEELENQKQIGL